MSMRKSYGGREMMEYDEGFVLLIFISSSYVSCVTEEEIFLVFKKKKKWNSKSWFVWKFKLG